MNNFQGVYRVVDFKWGYLIASFNTLKAALSYADSKGMRADHRKGEKNVYVIR